MSSVHDHKYNVELTFSNTFSSQVTLKRKLIIAPPSFISDEEQTLFLSSVCGPMTVLTDRTMSCFGNLLAHRNAAEEEKMNAP